MAGRSITNGLRGFAGPGGTLTGNGVVFSKRLRVAIADIIAGITLLAAAPGYKYRMVGCKAIAIGGSAATVTTVDVLATQSAASVKLVAYAQASLTQNTVLTSGGSGAAVLAGGLSYVPNDVNTAITISQTGSNIATATAVDFIIDFTLEP